MIPSLRSFKKYTGIGLCPCSLSDNCHPEISGAYVSVLLPAPLDLVAGNHLVISGAVMPCELLSTYSAFPSSAGNLARLVMVYFSHDKDLLSKSDVF